MESDLKFMKKSKYIKIISIILTIGFTLYIYHNSMYDIKQSDIQSGVVLRYLDKIFARMGYDVTFTQYVVRKLAHFTEYFILGMIVTITLRVFSKNLNKYLFFELFLFFAVPVLDESIQMFYKGRSSSVLDVLIDFAGCIVGLGLSRLLVHLYDSAETHEKMKS